MNTMSMAVDMDDEDFTSPPEKLTSVKQHKKLLFAGGQNFPTGSLHICAHCRRVKDVEGVWREIDRRMIFFNDVKLVQVTCDDCKQKA